MARVFKCRSKDCGHEQPLKWTGRCPGCYGFFAIYEANSFTDEDGEASAIIEGVPVSLQDAVEMEKQLPEVQRLETGIAGFDKVLGGGIVPGSLILLCGDPGSGKSTLLIQVFQALARRRQTCLYVTGEETVKQLASRYKGLGRFPPRLQALQATNLDVILDNVAEIKPAVFAVDSVQCVECDEDLETGSATSIKVTINELMKFAKTEGVAVFVIGHVTKGGSIGGPRALEHMVDVSMHLSGNSNSSNRILNVWGKNRFGKTPAKAFFEMSHDENNVVTGLVEVEEPKEPLETPLPTLKSISLETP